MSGVVSAYRLPRPRFRACLLGLAVGDAVGAAVEFMPRGSFPPLTDLIGGGPWALEPGQFTDDTSMALCLAESLVERQSFDPADQMERYVRWWKQGHWSATGVCFDIGRTTRAALERFARDPAQPYAGSTHARTAGNGSIMRLAPVPMASARDPDRAVELAAASSRTTHAAPAAVDGCRLLAAAIVAALEGRPKEEVLRAGAGLAYATPEIAALAQGSYRTKGRDAIRGSGYVVESLEAALWCFALTTRYRDAVLLAANLGDDADTTAAVVGQLAGAYYGLEGIPPLWLERLARRAEITALADGLHALALKRHVAGGSVDSAMEGGGGMSDLARRVLEQAVRVEEQWDALRSRLYRRLRTQRRYTIVPYAGMGRVEADGSVTVRLRGRVLEGSLAAPPELDASLWENLLASYRRLESDEVAGALVELTVGEARTVARTDGEGFYASLLSIPALGAEPWQQGRARLLEPIGGGAQAGGADGDADANTEADADAVEAAIPILVPRTADFLVISDIDDTILISQATRPLWAARLLLLENARSRESVAGVAAFYQALQRGTGPSTWNPIAYVSSSPWNLHDLLEDFLALQGIPAGPLLLRDYGLDADSLGTADHHAHKEARIGELLAFWPQLPCVLIGDSGQQDAAIYAEVAARHTHRVRAVYLREIGDSARAAAARVQAAAIEACGVPCLLFGEVAEAQAHAQALGLILPPGA